MLFLPMPSNHGVWSRFNFQLRLAHSHVFGIGVSDRPGHVEETYRLSRVKFLRFFVNREPATVVMEACGSAHHWGRQIRELGHEVVLISPQ